MMSHTVETWTAAARSGEKNCILKHGTSFYRDEGFPWGKIEDATRFTMATAEMIRRHWKDRKTRLHDDVSKDVQIVVVGADR